MAFLFGATGAAAGGTAADAGAAIGTTGLPIAAQAQAGLGEAGAASSSAGGGMAGLSGMLQSMGISQDHPWMSMLQNISQSKGGGFGATNDVDKQVGATQGMMAQRLMQSPKQTDWSWLFR